MRKGFVDESTLFIHGNILTKDDLARIRDAGAATSVTPESEMQMGMGTPVWPLAKEIGVRCGFGADIVSGGCGDLFTQMRLALAAGRLAANDRYPKASFSLGTRKRSRRGFIARRSGSWVRRASTALKMPTLM